MLYVNNKNFKTIEYHDKNIKYSERKLKNIYIQFKEKIKIRN